MKGASNLVVLVLALSGCAKDFDALFDGDGGALEGGGDGGAETGSVACTKGEPVCNVTCNADDCSLTCPSGSECLLTCGDHTTTCDIHCDTMKRFCNDRLVTCNRDCPN